MCFHLLLRSTVTRLRFDVRISIIIQSRNPPRFHIHYFYSASSTTLFVRTVLFLRRNQFWPVPLHSHSERTKWRPRMSAHIHIRLFSNLSACACARKLGLRDAEPLSERPVHETIRASHWMGRRSAASAQSFPHLYLLRIISRNHETLRPSIKFACICLRWSNFNRVKICPTLQQLWHDKLLHSISVKRQCQERPNFKFFFAFFKIEGISI
jgi:hypothetical protein